MSIDTKRLFDVIRQIKGAPLNQSDVDAVNAVLNPRGDYLATAISLIQQFEGCRLDAYPDPGTGGDPWTIGWGSTGPGIAKGVSWTQAQADARFAEDVARFAQSVNTAIGDATTTDNQRAAMISLAYNIGVTAFRNSTLLRMHCAGNYAGARAQFLRWNQAGGHVMAGLTRRRTAEAELYGR